MSSDARAIRHQPLRAPASGTVSAAQTAPAYEGLVTRALAFALDAAVINVVAIAVGAAVGLSLSVLSIPEGATAAILGLGGLAYLLWSVGYFVVFWSTSGQTPGNRVLGIKVCRADDGKPVRPARALLRLIALTLCAIPLLAGFVPVLFDARRRGLHDMLAGTVVVTGPVHGEQRLAERRSRVRGTRPAPASTDAAAPAAAPAPTGRANAAAPAAQPASPRSDDGASLRRD